MPLLPEDVASAVANASDFACWAHGEHDRLTAIMQRYDRGEEITPRDLAQLCDVHRQCLQRSSNYALLVATLMARAQERPGRRSQIRARARAVWVALRSTAGGEAAGSRRDL